MIAPIQDLTKTLELLEAELALKPSREEIESLKPWLLLRDASDLWPKRVETQLTKLLSRISRG